MGTGIIICGLNGAGKSTLGKALADQLKFHLIDIEDLYFPKADPLYPYASPRTRAEVEKLLCSEMTAHENFVFTSVKGDYGESVNSFFSMPHSLKFPKTSGCCVLKIALFRNLASGCCREEIYMTRKNASFISSNPEQRILLKNG